MELVSSFAYCNTQMNALFASCPQLLDLREAGFHKVRDTRDLPCVSLCHKTAKTALQEAAKEDAVVASSSCSQDGKFDILFPIALPDEGLESHEPWACDVAMVDGVGHTVTHHSSAQACTMEHICCLSFLLVATCRNLRLVGLLLGEPSWVH